MVTPADGAGDVAGRVGVGSGEAKRKRVPREGIPEILEFVEHKEYLGLSLSVAQRVLLKAIYGEALEGEEEWAIWRQCTGRERYLYTAARRPAQVTVIAGRRSGKDSRIAAPVAIYEAVYGEVAGLAADTGEPVVVH